MTDADVPDTLPPTDDPYRAPEAENPHAGKGSAVVLDIGGDVGAVIVTCPDPLLGREIEVVPAGSRAPGGAYADAPVEHTHDDHHDHHDHQHHDDHDHNDDHDHDHDHDDEPGHHHGDFHAGHDHPPGTPPHVGVVARPVDGRLVPTAVFGDLVEGRYEFALRPYGGTPDLEVDVVGGEVAMVDWPVG